MCPECGLLKDASRLPPPRRHRPTSSFWDELDWAWEWWLGGAVIAMALCAARLLLHGSLT